MKAENKEAKLLLMPRHRECFDKVVLMLEKFVKTNDFNQKDIFQAIEGIAIVDSCNLSRRLQQHALLKPTKIKAHTDIVMIVESIKNVL